MGDRVKEEIRDSLGKLKPFKSHLEDKGEGVFFNEVTKKFIIRCYTLTKFNQIRLITLKTTSSVKEGNKIIKAYYKKIGLKVIGETIQIIKNLNNE